MASSFSPQGACAPNPLHALGSQVIVNTLLEQGVEVVFGYLGAAVMPLFDQFWKLQDSTAGLHQNKRNLLQENKMSKTQTDSGIVYKPGSQVMVDMLLEQGVDTMFGYLGGVVLPFFDKLYDAPINFIIPRHEQGGCHMADAYARATGKVGVVVATSGPGATNLTTGLATAMMDSIPLVAITGQVRTDLIGNDAFQEADTTGITRPITKHNVIVKDLNDLAQAIREAFYIASTGRPGPVLVDIPVDIADCSVSDVRRKGEIDLPGYKVRPQGHARQISMAAEAINESKKPVLYVGGGVIICQRRGGSAQIRPEGQYPGDHDADGVGFV